MSQLAHPSQLELGQWISGVAQSVADPSVLEPADSSSRGSKRSFQSKL